MANGEYVQKWDHEWQMKQVKDKYSDDIDSQHVHRCGDYNKIRDLENKLDRIKTFLRHEL